MVNCSNVVVILKRFTDRDTNAISKTKEYLSNRRLIKHLIYSEKVIRNRKKNPVVEQNTKV